MHRPPDSAPEASAPTRRLPVINHDYCNGCSRCIEACPARCLALVWSFATLVNPAACTGEGACAEACPYDVIRMEAVRDASA